MKKKIFFLGVMGVFRGVPNPYLEVKEWVRGLISSPSQQGFSVL